VRRMLGDATVRLASGCTGAVAERSQLIVTATHCVGGRGSVGVRLADGETRTAWVVLADEAVDQAVLFLEEPTAVRPLRISRQRQIPGTVLYFAGNPARPVFQEGRLDRIGVCPSLPRLPNALFTSVAGRPGDSGAPLVNGAGEVVGLVHGGARCEIATPADTLLALVRRVLLPSPESARERAAPPQPPAG
jgi:S1-C subfamily serine protease